MYMLACPVLCTICLCWQCNCWLIHGTIFFVVEIVSTFHNYWSNCWGTFCSVLHHRVLQYCIVRTAMSRHGPWNNITRNPASLFPDDDEAVLVWQKLTPKRPSGSPEIFTKSCYGVYLMEFSNHWVPGPLYISFAYSIDVVTP